MASGRAVATVMSRTGVRSSLGSSLRPMSGGFFETFKDTISKEIEKNPELKKTLKELRDNESLTKASEMARDTSAKVSKTVSDAATAAGTGAAKAADIASDQAAQAAKMGEEIANKAAAQAKVAQAAASEAKRSFTGASEEAVKAQRHQDGSTDASNAHKAGQQTVTAPPLYERLLNDANSLFESIKGKMDASSGKPAPGSNTAHTAPGADGDGSSESSGGALVVREPTFWERNFNPESPFFERVRRCLISNVLLTLPAV